MRVQFIFLWKSINLLTEAPPLPLFADTWNAAVHSMDQRNLGLTVGRVKQQIEI